MSALAVLTVLVAAIAVLGVLLSRVFAKAGHDAPTEAAQPEVRSLQAGLAALAASLRLLSACPPSLDVRSCRPWAWTCRCGA